MTYYTVVVPGAANPSSRRAVRLTIVTWLAAIPAMVFADPVPAITWPFWFPVQVVWHVSLGDIPTVPPAFDNDRAYVALRDGRLVALSLVTGDPAWSASREVTSAPIAEGASLIGIQGSTVWALDRADGSTQWQRDLGAPALLSPAAASDWIAIVTDRADLVVLAAADGSPRWQQPLGSQATAVPVGNEQLVFAGLDDGRLLAFNAVSGKLVWTRRLGGRVLRLALIDARLYAGTADKFIYALAVGDGDVDWRWRTGGDPVGAAADARRVYIASLDNTLRALGRGAGDVKWERHLSSRTVGGPIVVGDYVVVAGVAPELLVYEAATGTPLTPIGLPGRALHKPRFEPWSGAVPSRIIVLTAGGEFLALAPGVEPPLVTMTEVFGPVAAAEKLADIEPPLQPMLSPPGRLLPPETMPVIR